MSKPSFPSHPQIVDGWFKEKPLLWPGQAMCLEIEEVLHMEQSALQDILIFKSKTYGVVFALDGVVQCSERDEFAYQEMITHLPLNCHPDPRKVLVIGGGDGGVLREIVKHESVEEVILCEIDDAVIRVAKKYLPNMAVGFDHPKVKVVIQDGFEYLKEKLETYDAIIIDTSDPIGPAESLFRKDFFKLVRDALRPGGLMSIQAECQWLHLSFIKEIHLYCIDVFPVAEYAYTTIPTYPSGQIGLFVCCKEEGRNLRKPLRRWTPEQEEKLCKYYNAEIHEASFILPTFTRSFIDQYRPSK
ncbi:5164_t:CDS:2 [Paraglomus brasilianum]|uniref:5164_t:CDS:1 n=1 Tax=Paraglomus brasilianum TaxID=144538 RepID=A0A9N8Z6Z7_9GLOM|nr:5164_t:CDS:2 [Paraglomus brasilianum]